MKIFAETDRLILREILPEDLNGMYELDSDPVVHKYLGNKPVTDRRQIMDIINFVRQQYADHGIGRWAIVEKETENFIGWTGLKFVKEMINDHINYYDLGYRLIRKYWGQGFATESAIASLAYGFDQLGIDRIYAAAHVENRASNRVLKKLGFQMQGTFHYDGALDNWYEIKKTEWT